MSSACHWHHHPPHLRSYVLAGLTRHCFASGIASKLLGTLFRAVTWYGNRTQCLLINTVHGTGHRTLTGCRSLRASEARPSRKKSPGGGHCFASYPRALYRVLARLRNPQPSTLRVSAANDGLKPRCRGQACYQARHQAWHCCFAF